MRRIWSGGSWSWSARVAAKNAEGGCVAPGRAGDMSRRLGWTAQDGLEMTGVARWIAQAGWRALATTARVGKVDERWC
jgi:hypothetical protein